jgi:predicted metal-dependent HD superfamily phosphohydrolase
MIYRQKRLAFLVKTMKAKAIYCTPEFKKMYEKIARENLQWEIDNLKATL